MTRRRTVSLSLAAALVLAGCAHPSAAGSTSVAAPTPAQSPCATLAAPARITDADTGRTVCVAVGDQVDVFLSSTPGRPWAPIAADGAALAPRPSGVGALAIGVTGGFYRGAAAGTTRLTSQRLACVDPGPSCGPATFEVTVVVR